MPWEVLIASSAKKSLRRLPDDLRDDVERALDLLSADPSRVDLRKLSGRQDEWRVRVRDWRVILRLDSERGVILVKSIEPRGSAYRG